MNPRFLVLAVATLLSCTAVAQQEPLGRLFYTPEQRAALDRQRLRGPATGVDNGGPLTLNGRVARSSGRNTTWVNGVAMDEQNARTIGRVPSRPGETSRGAGENTDLLNGGKISIRRPPLDQQ